jgi:hypothetical protein
MSHLGFTPRPLRVHGVNPYFEPVFDDRSSELPGAIAISSYIRRITARPLAPTVYCFQKSSSNKVLMNLMNSIGLFSASLRCYI